MIPINKCKRKPMGKSIMENQETLATLGTQDTGRRQIKRNITPQRKPKNTTRIHQNK